MTIIYQYKVATTSFFGFFALLRRWRGSVYKHIYIDAAVFIGLYTIISLVYRFALDSAQRKTFEQLARYCNSYTSLIPVSFVLGFYVTIIVNRWWQQFSNVPWPDRTLYVMGSYLVGLDEHGRILRRTVARYMLFAWILILRSVSVSVMKRYPTLQHIVDAGYITHEEAGLYEKVECKYNKFWVPLVWANGVLTQARKEGRIESEIGFRLILEYIADYRDKCSLCFVYDWITIPLVYTQVVTLAVYTFFGACLIGRQYVDNPSGNPDLYVPFFTFMQFFFYLGWLKVAEQMINPFGEDDDDYDMNWLLDRHTAVAMCIVDQCHANYPPLIKDAHFNDIEPDLPYTKAAMSSKRPNFMGSTYNIPRPSIVEQQIHPIIRYTDDPEHMHRVDSRVRFRNPSKWSLFGFKPSTSRGSLSNSRDNILFSPTLIDKDDRLGPLDTRQKRDSVNGKLGPAGIEIPAGTELPPEYIPLKHLHFHNKGKSREKPQKLVLGRKWSFPLGHLRRKHIKQPDARRGISVAAIPTHDPQLESHVTVEMIKEDHGVDTARATTDPAMEEELIPPGVYRPTLLSAIEEANTVRNVQEIADDTGFELVRSSHSLHPMESVEEEEQADVSLDDEIPRTNFKNRDLTDIPQKVLTANTTNIYTDKHSKGFIDVATSSKQADSANMKTSSPQAPMRQIGTQDSPSSSPERSTVRIYLEEPSGQPHTLN